MRLIQWKCHTFSFGGACIFDFDSSFSRECWFFQTVDAWEYCLSRELTSSITCTLTPNDMSWHLATPERIPIEAHHAMVCMQETAHSTWSYSTSIKWHSNRGEIPSTQTCPCLSSHAQDNQTFCACSIVLVMYLLVMTLPYMVHICTCSYESCIIHKLRFRRLHLCAIQRHVKRLLSLNLRNSKFDSKFDSNSQISSQSISVQ